jgi:putative redox protein
MPMMLKLRVITFMRMNLRPLGVRISARLRLNISPPRWAAERKKWPAGAISCQVKMHKDNGRQVFVREVSIAGALDDKQRARMIEIANKCPVHKVLIAGSDVETVLA